MLGRVEIRPFTNDRNRGRLEHSKTFNSDGSKWVTAIRELEMLPRYLTWQLLLLDDFSSASEPASKMFSTLFLSSKFASMIGEWSVDFCEDFGRLW